MSLHKLFLITNMGTQIVTFFPTLLIASFDIGKDATVTQKTVRLSRAPVSGD